VRARESTDAGADASEKDAPTGGVAKSYARSGIAVVGDLCQGLSAIDRLARFAGRTNS